VKQEVWERTYNNYFPANASVCTVKLGRTNSMSSVLQKLVFTQLYV